MLRSRNKSANRFSRVSICIIAAFFLASLFSTGCADTLKNIRFYRPEPAPPDQSELDSKAEELINIYIDSVKRWDYDSAMDALDELTAINARMYYPLDFYRSFLYLRLGKYDESLELINLLSPGYFNTDFLQARAEIYKSMRRYDESVGDLEKFITATGTEKSYPLYLYRQVAMEIGNADKAKEMLDLLVRNHPLDRYTLFCRIYEALDNRDFATAEDVMQRLASMRITDEGGMFDSEFYSVYLIFARARMAYEQGEIDRAIDILKAIPDSWEYMTGAWTTLAWVEMAHGRFAEAKILCLEGIARFGGTDHLINLGYQLPASTTDMKNPTRFLRHDTVASLFANLGMLELMEGNIDSAISCAETALSINYYETSAYEVKSSALELKGDIDGAISVAISGLTKNKYSGSLIRAYAELAKSAPAAVPQGSPSAESMLSDEMKRCENMCRVYTENLKARMDFALVREALEIEDSCGFYQWASELFPERYDVMTGHAVCLAESGDIEPALIVFGKFNYFPDIPILVAIYKRAEKKKNANLLEFANHLRQLYDPERRLDSLLEPFITGAIKAIESASDSDSPDSET
ncbi:MAG TPA: hypothetical protein ENN67_07515 [Firmicutes bacterium]|nr:hypothetical protein [Bacillota bacterium]